MKCLFYFSSECSFLKTDFYLCFDKMSVLNLLLPWVVWNPLFLFIRPLQTNFWRNPSQNCLIFLYLLLRISQWKRVFDLLLNKSEILWNNFWFRILRSNKFPESFVLLFVGILECQTGSNFEALFRPITLIGGLITILASYGPRKSLELRKHKCWNKPLQRMPALLAVFLGLNVVYCVVLST